MYNFESQALPPWLREPLPEPPKPKKYKITLADGTAIENLRMNGNNFVSQTEINNDIFEGNLSPVEILVQDEDGGNAYTEHHEHMEYLKTQKYEDGYYFVLLDIPKQVLKEREIISSIEYLSMMTDVPLALSFF